MNTGYRNELKAIFLKHYKEWCLLSFGYLENETEAEDVVQDVFVKILLNKNRSEIKNLKSYVHVAVKNTSISKAKKLGKHRKVEWLPTAIPSFETQMLRAEMNANLYKEIEALPIKSKKVFEMCILDGQKYEIAADTLGISVNTVKYHLKKSFKSLRSNLRNTYYLPIIIASSIFF